MRGQQAEDAKMKFGFALMALGILIVSSGAPPILARAVAATAKCAAGCDNWCAKNFPQKNTTACSQQCQLRHCK
jgi:hypothetical protein